MNKIKIIYCFFIVLLFSCTPNSTFEGEKQLEKISSPQSQNGDFPRLIYTQEQINFVAGKINERSVPYYPAYTKLISTANNYLERQHAATEDFHTPRFYGEKDENIEAKSGLALDTYAAHANALAFALNGDTVYAKKAIYFLNAWADINKSITEIDSEGETTGTVLTASNLMSGFLIAADLLSGHEVWKEDDKTRFHAWVKNILLPNAHSIKGRSNNWGDWGTFATAASYHILGRKTELSNEVERMKLRIDSHQADDGSMPQETRRESNGLWYTYFALVPMTLSAQLAFNTNDIDLFHWESSNGRTIQKALDYLEYYELHKSEWPWYSMKDSQPTKDAPTDLFEAMNSFYDNKYNSFVRLFRPVHGGYKGTRVSHTGWSFPTLMRMTDREPSKYPEQ